MTRAEEKEQRRREREAAEQAARKSAENRKRLGMVGGGVLLVAIVAVVVLLVAGGGDDGEGQASGASNASLPAVQIENLSEAARAAGCKVREDKEESSSHVQTDVKYKQNPPESGDHDPVPSREGVYGADNPPDIEQSVHALEHGRINIQYKPGTPQQRIDQLAKLFEEKVQGIAGYKTLVFQNQTNMPYAVAATAWTKALTCPAWNDKVFDAIRAFRRDNVDKGPEQIPSDFE
jgi:hypothetical protein